MKIVFEIIFGLILIIVVIALCIIAVQTFILYLFPNLMQTLRLSEFEMTLFVIGVMLIFLIAAIYIYNSIYRDEIIKGIIKIVIGIVLPILAYWVYPEGIMDKPLSMITLGGIGRLVIVLMLIVAFIADVYCLIFDIP